MRRRTIAVHAPLWPKGMWNRSGVWPPIWIDRALDRYAYGAASSIYPPKPKPPKRMTIQERIAQRDMRIDPDLPF